jgi:S-adenosylmethionine/arginine decarboxylase-like enzyme
MITTHKHLIVKAYVNSSFDSIEAVKAWLKNIIKAVNMDLAEVPGNPMAYYCTDKGNTGYTGVAILETSHTTIHTWDEFSPHSVMFDLYSCSDFTPEQVFTFLEDLGVTKADYYFIDRGEMPRVIFLETYNA